MASPGPDSNSGGGKFEEWRAPVASFNSFDSTGSIIDNGSPTRPNSQTASNSVLSSSSGIETVRGCAQSCHTVDNDSETSATEVHRDQHNVSNTTSDIIDGIRMIHLMTPQQVPKSSARTARAEGNNETSDSSVPEVNISKPPSAVSLTSPALSTASAGSNNSSTTAATTYLSSSDTISGPTGSGDTPAIDPSSSLSATRSFGSKGPATVTSSETAPSVDGARAEGPSAGTNGTTVATSENKSSHADPSPLRPGRSSTPNSYVEEQVPGPNISAVNSPPDSPLPRNCLTLSNIGLSVVDGHRPADPEDQEVPHSSASTSGHNIPDAQSSSSSTGGQPPFDLRFAEYIQKYYIPAYGQVGNTSVDTVVRRLHLAVISDSTSSSSTSSVSSQQNSNTGRNASVSTPPALGNTLSQLNRAVLPEDTPSSDSDSEASNGIQEPPGPLPTSSSDQRRSHTPGTSARGRRATSATPNTSTPRRSPRLLSISHASNIIQVPPAPAPASSGGQIRSPAPATSARVKRGTSAPPNTSTPPPRRSPRLLSSSLSNAAANAGRFPEQSTPVSDISGTEEIAEVATPTQLNFDLVRVYPRFFELKSGFSVPKRSFRLVCSAILQKNHAGFRFSAESVESLQTATEDFLVKMFEGACKITGVRKSATTAAKDVRIAMALKEPVIYDDLPPLQNLVKRYQKRKAQKPVKLFQAASNNDMSFE